MKRIDRNGRILYVERHLLWSALYFIGTVLGIAVAFAVKDDPDRSFLGVVLIGTLILVLLAFRDLFRARVFRISIADGTLEYFLRTWPWSRIRTTVPLTEITVVLDTQVYTHRTPSRYGSGGSTWVANVPKVLLAVKAKKPIVFMKRIRGIQASQLAEALAADLERPLERVEREGGTPSSSRYGPS